MKKNKTEAEEAEENLAKDLRNKQAESSKRDEKNHNEKQENNVDINKKSEVKNKVNEKLIDHPKLKKLPKAVACLHPKSLE